MTATVVRGDALRLPLADETVDLVVTSPPYFGLRSYTDSYLCIDCYEMQQNGRDPKQAWPDYDKHYRQVHVRHYDGQLGSEPTPAEYVDALLAATREMVRVLKPSGSIWVNLGDKYAGSRMDGSNDNGTGSGSIARTHSKPPIRDERVRLGQGIKRSTDGVSTKSLMGIPWRYALACIDQLGLILRAEIIWSKPNGLPESVTDRVRRSHEQWFHFVRQPRYYSAVDEVREAHSTDISGWRTGSPPYPNGQNRGPFVASTAGITSAMGQHSLGKLPGSVWTIPTEPLTVPAHLGVDHFAAFPTEWPRRIIAGWSPPGVCVECGEGRRPDVNRTPMEWRESPTMVGRRNGKSYRPASGTMLTPASATITGYVCACTPYTDYPGTATGVTTKQPRADNGSDPREMFVGSVWDRERVGPWREYHHAQWTPAPTRPATVLDPFGGTGTTALVADILGRHGISLDLSADYNRLATWRTRDPGQRARAARVDKPPPVIDGQLTLEGLA